MIIELIIFKLIRLLWITSHSDKQISIISCIIYLKNWKRKRDFTFLYLDLDEVKFIQLDDKSLNEII